MMRVERPFYLKEISKNFQVQPICAILGARQVGKTTLAHMYVQKYQDEAHFFDLENPLDVQRLENPMLAFTSVTQPLIVIDEIQRRPELFPLLRVLVDDPTKHRRFLILGSASRDLIKQSSETLAGRIGFIELPPLSTTEVGESKQLWIRGGFPRSYLADTDENSFLWRRNYINTFLERDIPNLGFNIPAQQLQRFWLMLAHYHGQIFNASELARSLAISDHTVRRYLDILAGTFMVRILPPWFENLKKRQVKSPKIYFRDSGILHALIGVANTEQLQINPKLGSFWEGFALEEVVHACRATTAEAYFWSISAGAELDLLIVKNGKRLGFEIKYVDVPKITKSMHAAQELLKLDHLGVVFPGNEIFPLSEQVTAYGFDTLISGEFEKKICKI